MSQGCIREIPLNPPLQKGEEVGIPRLIEKLRKNSFNIQYSIENSQSTSPPVGPRSRDLPGHKTLLWVGKTGG